LFFISIYHHFKKYLLSGQKEYALDLAETMRKNANDYFASMMDELFAERMDETGVEVMIEFGMTPRQDKVTGEIIWKRAI